MRANFASEFVRENFAQSVVIRNEGICCRSCRCMRSLHDCCTHRWVFLVACVCQVNTACTNQPNNHFANQKPRCADWSLTAPYVTQIQSRGCNTWRSLFACKYSPFYGNDPRFRLIFTRHNSTKSVLVPSLRLFQSPFSRGTLWSLNLFTTIFIPRCVPFVVNVGVLSNNCDRTVK